MPVLDDDVVECVVAADDDAVAVVADADDDEELLVEVFDVGKLALELLTCG